MGHRPLPWRPRDGRGSFRLSSPIAPPSPRPPRHPPSRLQQPGPIRRQLI
ncbi:hypothetical protein KBY81_08695 [Cyanobium sp. Lug-B]|nr:hypothetical protein [Cyanobium sp. Lug-B]